MKKIMLYFLLVFFLFSNGTLSEIAKLPFLAIHYLDHESRDPQLTVVDFLAMHYLGRDLKDADTDKDMKLPFKKISHIHSQVLMNHVQQHYSLDQKPSLVFVYRPGKQEDLKSSLLAKLFRPPIG